MKIRKLQPQFNHSTLNVGKPFDTPTGGYVQGTFPEVGELKNGSGKIIGLSVPHRPMGNGLSMRAMKLCNEGIDKTVGGTVERFRYAGGLFNLMGFTVKWDGTTKEPEVTWCDTEGWSNNFDVNEFIRAKLHDNVEVKEDHVRLGEHFYTQVANLKANEKNHVDLTIDSYSVDV